MELVARPAVRKWIEWRASVIKDFVTEAHRQLKEINPRLLIGDYTGAWYPTYYYVGVNWASEHSIPPAISIGRRPNTRIRVMPTCSTSI